jgi:hypothetical protein
MRAKRSRMTSLLGATGAACAMAAMICAPAAAADDTIACEPGQIVIDGNCNVPPVDNYVAPADDNVAPVEAAPIDGSVDLGRGGVDVGTGGVDLGGGGVDIGGGDVGGGHGH